MTIREARSGVAARLPALRRGDRRHHLRTVLATVARALPAQTTHGALRSAFEESLARVFPVRFVRLRDVSAPSWRDEEIRTGERFAFAVPGAEGVPAAVLEAVFDQGRAAGEWDVQVLGLSAQVAALVLEIERLRTQLARAGLVTARRPADASPLVGSTPAMQRLRRTIERVAGTDFTVLLDGESGVGKELVARQIHEQSRRRNGPFVAVNCAALVETLLEAELFGIEERTATGVRGRRGKFELADGGTLFLDEVSDLSAPAQAKLLRAIQDLSVQRVGGAGTRRVDIRIVAATNRSLSELVGRQLFRADLFYRLSGVDIRVPTLRERRADVLELARCFLERHRPHRTLRLSPGAVDALLAYDWPGNVRELERLIERAVALAETDVIDVGDLPPAVRGDFEAALAPSLARNDTMRAWGSRYARLIVDRCRGNKREACRVLNLSYHTLQGYLRYPIHDAAPARAGQVRDAHAACGAGADAG